MPISFSYGNINEKVGVGVCKTGTVLDEIVETKKERLVQQKKELPLEKLLDIPPQNRPSLYQVLAAKPEGAVHIIAEFKVASPSKGLILESFDPSNSPEQYFRQYEKFGASALSVLTEESYFRGSFDYVRRACLATKLPILCKDFIVDPYQLALARYYGASAVLLIVALLEKPLLQDLLQQIKEIGLDALVETHTEEELTVALEVGASIIGINNRNLKTFATSLTVTETLAPHVRNKALVVAESGIKTREDASRMKDAGVAALLVGETLMRASDLNKTMQELRFC